MPEPSILENALETVNLDAPALKASVENLRKKHPKECNAALAARIFSGTAFWASTTGVATGLATNPLAALPAAVTDLSITLSIEVQATAKVALVYDPDFFDGENARWELLVPVLGINAVSQVTREFGIRGVMNVTRAGIKKYLSKETLKYFKKGMLKYFGLKVTQKAFVTKTLPIVGGLIGGAWNWLEVCGVRARAIDYFEGRPLSAVPPEGGGSSTASSQPAAAAAAGAEGRWACAVCTLQNSAAAARCEACETPRGAVAPVAPVSREAARADAATFQLVGVGCCS
jgi:hypothetical protein